MKTIIFRVIPDDQYGNVLKEEIKEVEKNIRQKKILSATETVETVTFQTTNALFQFLSPINLDILNILKTKKPKSLTELAKELQKNKAVISKKVKILELFGLVKCHERKSKGNIPAKVVKPVFDRIIIDVGWNEINTQKAS